MHGATIKISQNRLENGLSLPYQNILVNILRENISIHVEYCTKITKGTLKTQYKVGQHPDQ